MIRMSKQTDYGIVLLTYFASDSATDLLSARELAEESGIPMPMVSKILKTLARKGLLVSHRGVKGGYQLARMADQISIAEVIRILEGPISITECSDQPSDCRHEMLCPVRSNWQKLNLVVMKALQGISLSDMARPLPDKLVSLAGARCPEPKLTESLRVG